MKDTELPPVADLIATRQLTPDDYVFLQKLAEHLTMSEYRVILNTDMEQITGREFKRAARVLAKLRRLKLIAYKKPTGKSRSYILLDRTTP